MCPFSIVVIRLYFTDFEFNDHEMGAVKSLAQGLLSVCLDQ
jgi:hypothetical protein